ncbi:MAG: hypothetical protein SGBAC_003986 [Bacillariaceae sp.]
MRRSKQESAPKTRQQAPAPVVRRNQVSPQKIVEEEVIDIIPIASESPQKKQESGEKQADPDDFGANFDGFYTRPRSYPASARSQDSIPATTEASEYTESVAVDHRGKKFIKPVPGWYKKGEVITDTQHAAQIAQQTPKGFDNINLFQCGTDTTMVDDDEKYEKFADPASSINGDKETATGFTSTKASTAVTSYTSKMEERQSPEADESDLVNLARSAKRRIEAEFFARIYGTPAEGVSSPVSPERKASTRRGPPSFGGDEQAQKQPRFQVPRTIEMKTPPKSNPISMSTSPVSPSSASLMDKTSDSVSGNDDAIHRAPSDESSERVDNLGFIPMYGGKDKQGGSAYPPTKSRTWGNRADSRPKSPDGDIDNLLGPFVPFVKSATTRSNNYSVGASQVTRMQSNKERGEIVSEATGFVLQHHPAKGLSGYRQHSDEEERRPEFSMPDGSKIDDSKTDDRRKPDDGKPRKPPRTTHEVPDLVVGYDKASADESEITMDKRQFRKKREEAPTFWNYWTSPTHSTLSRSMQ